ncbi:MAG: RadC family protein [Alphaproteobacteria bacterium]|nr:RadC family protein [Alphaproteobacteria bacterium]
MSKSDELFHNGHRDRLKQKLLNGKLAGYEKLELLLTYAIPRRDVRPLARTLIQRFGGVYFVLCAPYEELLRVPGVGPGVATIIKLFHQLSLVSYQERAENGQYLSDDKFIRDYCRALVAGKPVEEFHVLYLDGNSRLIMHEVHNRGTFNQADVYPREVARQALSINAVSVILVHNHPVSDNSFSYDDAETTSLIEKCLNMFGISLVDHFVVTSNGTVHSMRATPFLNKSSFFK